jgi:hypothetical protein
MDARVSTPPNANHTEAVLKNTAGLLAAKNPGGDLMDVLQFIKTSHDQIRGDLGRFLGSDGVKARRSAFETLSGVVSFQLMLERDYLYPELPGLFAEADVVVATGLANGSVLSKKLKLLEKTLAKALKDQAGIEKKIGEFSALLESHFSQQEQHLMPKLRQTMRTEDREELGRVFEDVKSDLIAEAGEQLAKNSVQARKRA